MQADNFRPHLHSSSMVSALARAGWLVDPTTMLYALAGYTGAQFNYEDLTNDGEPNNRFWANGVTVGGGLEEKLAQNWSVRFEYRYTDFMASNVSNDFLSTSSSQDTQTDTTRARFAEDMQTARVGISYLLPTGQ
jgi:opacity protein-like surface antigen